MYELWCINALFSVVTYFHSCYDYYANNVKTTKMSFGFRFNRPMILSILVLSEETLVNSATDVW